MKMSVGRASLTMTFMLLATHAVAGPVKRMSLHSIYGGTLDTYRLSSDSEDGGINIIIPANEKVADKLKEIFSGEPARTSLVCDVKYFPFLLHDNSKYASVFHLENCSKEH